MTLDDDEAPSPRPWSEHTPLTNHVAVELTEFDCVQPKMGGSKREVSRATRRRFGQPTWMVRVCQPVAPSGSGRATSSVCV